MESAKDVRAKLCIDCECVFDAGCGCLEAIEAYGRAVAAEAILAWIEKQGDNPDNDEEVDRWLYNKAEAIRAAGDGKA